MAKRDEQSQGLVTSYGEIPDGLSLMEIWQGSKEETAEVSGILAEAIEDWLLDTTVSSPEESAEVREARDLAKRYRYPYIDLFPADGRSPVNKELLNELPDELMLRHQFVPLRKEGKRLHIAIANPTDLEQMDELASALQARIVP